MHQTLTVALVAVLVLLAGCSAGTGGDATATDAKLSDGTDATTAADAATGGDESPSGDEATTAESSAGRGDSDGSVDFYLSDRPSAIGDFDHLNVTVTKVGVHRAGDGNGSESGEWQEFDVNATADLTRLQGANASKIGAFALPNGSYTKAFVYVSETEGVVNGEAETVKLPSGKLQLNRGFTVGDGADVDFVFDVTVHEAGKSGKYVLSPVVGESGTGDEVEIRDVDRPEADEDGAETEGETATASDADANSTQTAAGTTETATPATETVTPATSTTASDNGTATG